MGERLTVLCWLWSQPNGRAKYTAEHVNIWRAMVARNLTLDHEIACVTDMPAGIDPSVRIIPPPNEFIDVSLPRWGAERPQCLRRLSMFRPDAAVIFNADRIVCMDLDVIVCASLDPVLDVRDDFKITRGTAARRAYNGSMMSLRVGSRPQAYKQFTPERAIEASLRHVGSDQSWIAHILPGERTWDASDGVRFWTQHQPIESARVIFFAGAQKPWTLATLGRESAITKHYRGSRRDRCLILGYGESLWSDVEVALGGERHFGGIIASPEAARHLSAPVLAIADDDDHAERLAAMHGFTDVVFCGRSVGGHAHGASG